MTTTVQISRLTQCYGVIEAVRDVSFELQSGEIIALVGHNGAGKTTLFKLMLGLARPSAGTIRVLGEDPTAGEFAGRRSLGYLPENVSFNPALTGREVLSFYAGLKNQPVAQALERYGRINARSLATLAPEIAFYLGLAVSL